MLKKFHNIYYQKLIKRNDTETQINSFKAATEFCPWCKSATCFIFQRKFQMQMQQATELRYCVDKVNTDIANVF